MHLAGNTILITGGTSGIGRALAEALHQRGNKIIIAGRRRHLLDEIVASNPGMTGMILDVEDPRSIDTFAADVQARFPDLNVLVNNAGICKPEDIAAGVADLSLARSMIAINVLAVLQLTTALLATLRGHAKASIITTTSGLAFVPRSNYPTYCASKAFLHSWVQSLRVQLRDTSVEVLELVPPHVQTELSGPAQANDPSAMRLADYMEEVLRGLERSDPEEILVERVKGLRFAERNGTYAAAFARLNGP